MPGWKFLHLNVELRHNINGILVSWLSLFLYLICSRGSVVSTLSRCARVLHRPFLFLAPRKTSDQLLCSFQSFGARAHSLVYAQRLPQTVEGIILPAHARIQATHVRQRIRPTQCVSNLLVNLQGLLIGRQSFLRLALFEENVADVPQRSCGSQRRTDLFVDFQRRLVCLEGFVVFLGTKAHVAQIAQGVRPSQRIAGLLVNLQGPLVVFQRVVELPRTQ